MEIIHSRTEDNQEVSFNMFIESADFSKKKLKIIVKALSFKKVFIMSKNKI